MTPLKPFQAPLTIEVTAWVAAEIAFFAPLIPALIVEPSVFSTDPTVFCTPSNTSETVFAQPSMTGAMNAQATLKPSSAAWKTCWITFWPVDEFTA